MAVEMRGHSASSSEHFESAQFRAESEDRILTVGGEPISAEQDAESSSNVAEKVIDGAREALNTVLEKLGVRRESPESSEALEQRHGDWVATQTEQLAEGPLATFVEDLRDSVVYKHLPQLLGYAGGLGGGVMTGAELTRNLSQFGSLSANSSMEVGGLSALVAAGILGVGHLAQGAWERRLARQKSSHK